MLISLIATLEMRSINGTDLFSSFITMTKHGQLKAWNMPKNSPKRRKIALLNNSAETALITDY